MQISTVNHNLGHEFSPKNFLLQYEKLENLGEGGFGCVYKAKNMLTSEIVAIKQIDIKDHSAFINSEWRHQNPKYI